jgi:hypothetical protein
MLTVPLPRLAYEPLAPGVAAAEQPLSVTVGPVLDGPRPQTPVELRTFGLVGYRRSAPGALLDVWDPEGKQWWPEGTAVAAETLAFRDDQPDPWQAVLVAGGGDRFALGQGGYPAYSFRALFTGADETAISGPSDSVSFGSVADRNLMVLGPGDGEKPESATQARVLLKDTALQVIGGLVVRRDVPGAEVTLSNAAGASVVLRPDGAIELRPAAGRGVTVAGDIETERVVYRPAGGGAKQTLP